MDESKVLSLIAEGEGTTIEFKRELDLSSARNKAEFAKDIISLANSAPDAGFMLVGVNKAKMVVGLDKLEEEQIQHVAHTYITPPVTLKCIVVPVQSPGPLSVGVIEARATSKPHKVARAIEQLTQNDVFVRHGSVVVKASPEEIKALYDESQIGGEARQFIRAAETHAKLGNVMQAIKSYSRAIELSPVYDLFIARGKLYERLLNKVHTYIVDGKNWAELAYKDFSDALKLANSNDAEKEARFGRFRLVTGINDKDADEAWDQDFEWLKANTQGRERGELLYREVDTYDGNSRYVADEPEKALATLTEAIQLGYGEPDVYQLRAEAHFFSCNYGLALRDIDMAIGALGENNPASADYFCLRANILSAMVESKLHPQEFFDEAYENMLKARHLAHKELPDSLGYIAWDLETHILYRYALRYEFANRQHDEVGELLIRMLVIQYGGFEEFRRVHPKIANTIKTLVGEDAWQLRKIYFSK